MEEEEGDATGSAKGKGFMHDSDATCLQINSTTGSREDVSTLFNKFYVVLSHIQFIFTSLLCPIFSFALESGQMKMA